MRKILKSQDGFAALIALIMIGMLTLIGLAALSTSDDEMNIAGNEVAEMRAFYAAEAGLEYAASQLQSEYVTTGLPPTSMPHGADSINGCAVSFATVDNGPAEQRTLPHGTLAGLHALVKSFSITDTAVNNNDDARVIMSQTFETALIPIFQFAIFYEDILEIAPGPVMNLIGRVHSNGDLYIQAGNALNVDSYITAAGDLYHGRKPGCPAGTSSGDVKIKNSDGNYVTMKEGSGWLDAGDGHWYDSSLGRWQGRVQDVSHGQESLNLPLTTSAAGDPYALIARGAGNPDSYENKATLKIINDTAWYFADSSWIDVTDSLIDRGIMAQTDDMFTDKREATTVDVTDLDMEALYDSTFNITGVGVTDLSPENGVLYFGNEDTAANFPALRLGNADELGDGLTVASMNPVYTWGDYNSTDKKPAAIMADAITYLSDQWDDALSSLNLDDRNLPVNTTVNASYLTGNTETTNTAYSGGFENLPRFLEKWSGKDFNWNGSAVCLWMSRQGDGEWGKSNVYKPPNRNWFYDTDLDDPANLPPETPMVRKFFRVGWQQEYVGYE